MSAFVYISPSDDLIQTVAARLVTHEGDYSSNLVVFSGHRPSHFLRQYIAQTVNGPFIPPRTLAVDELVEMLAAKHRSSSVRNVDVPDAIALLFDIHQKLSRRLGGEHFTDLDQFFPLGEKLFRDLEELKLANVSTNEIREKTNVISIANLDVIAEMFDVFYASCEEHGFATRAMNYALAARQHVRGDIGEYERVVVAGLYAMTPVEQMLFKIIAGYDCTTMVFVHGPGLRRRVEGLDPTGDETTRDEKEPEVTFVKSPDLHGQVAALTAALNNEISSGTTLDERSVLVLPRPEALFPVVNHLLPLLPQDGYNVSMGYPIVRTPLYGLFRSIGQACEVSQDGTYFVPDYLRVLTHPYVKNIRIKGRTDVTRIIVHSIEEILTEQSGRAFRRLEEVEENDELMTALALKIGLDDVTAEDIRAHVREVHDLFFRAWKKDGTFGGFAKTCADIVRFIYAHTTASRHPYFRDFANTMLVAVEDLGESLLAKARTGSLSASFRVLSHFLSTTTVPFPGSPLQGFQVLGLLETRGLNFDRVYVVDANDDALPGGGSNPPLLPQAVRRALHLQTQKDREEIIEYYLSVLFASAKSVWVSWNESDGNERSRFVEKMIWNQQRKNGSFPITDPSSEVAYDVKLHPQKPDPIFKSPSDVGALLNITLSASALDTLSRCQIRFYYEYVLRLSEREEVAGEVEAVDIGKAVHTILERFFGRRINARLSTESLDEEEMARTAAEVCDEMFGPPSTAASMLIRERIVAQMSAYLNGYQRPLAARYAPELLELESSIRGRIGPLECRARIDRVERRTGSTPEHRIAILDYKTGSNPDRNRVRFDRLDPADQNTWSNAIGSLQLYVYATIYAKARGLRREDLEAAYLYLGMNETDEDVEVGLFDPSETDRKGKFEMLDAVVGRMIADLQDTSRPFVPTEHFESECPQCPFTTMCGTNWTRQRKE